MRGTRLGSLLIEVVRLAKVFRAILLPPSCRFAPTCSQYAETALERHSVGRAAALISQRLLRCHPWHPGGLDPVP